MTPTEVSTKLRQFNEWRMGDYEPSEQPDPPNPYEVSLVIDAAVEMINRLEAAESDAAHQKALADSALRVSAKWEGKCHALRAELAQLHKEADKFGDGVDWIQRALQAEAQIEQMERQEPVAWMNSRNGFICKENKNPDYNVPLKRLDLGAQTQGEEK